MDFINSYTTEGKDKLNIEWKRFRHGLMPDLTDISQVFVYQVKA